ncbi:MAG: DNA mismatch repair protein MutS [Ruminococcaceae bacterium]|nr:DNA mismatch repair protein MutS [Oscillospiraceae bacterium]
MAELSPMMKQYLEIKDNNKDSILFFRLGDFYEMFFDDAKLASKELGLTLTGRDCGQEERAPMCGVPFHSCDTYIAKLVAKGYKVAICEQTEDPSKAKGIVRRDVVRVITSGTLVEETMLDESRNNYICSAYSQDSSVGVSFCDISTGQLYVSEIDADNLKDQLVSFSPKEILLGGDLATKNEFISFIKERLNSSIEVLGVADFDYFDCLESVATQFSSDQVVSIKEKTSVIGSLGALLKYLKRTQMTGLERIRTIDFYKNDQYMRLDFNTRRNLELTQTMITKEKKGSLLWVLDHTKTAMGKRMLRSWIEKPLLNLAAIQRRQSAVAELVDNTVKRLELTAMLSGVLDVQRIMTKIVYGSANARELRSLCSATINLPQIKDILKDSTSSYLKDLYNSIDTLQDIQLLIDASIIDDPPFSTKEGGMIRQGYNAELDEINLIMTDSTSLLAQIESSQREATGIPKLKVGYSRVFGYFIEVTNSYKELVPDTYVRKQTLANCERYITQELKELEGKILGAKDKAVALEYEIFTAVRLKIAENLQRIEATTDALSQLDVLCSLATVASDNRYTRPEMDMSSVISLKASRHPVVETLIDNPRFVSNDVYLDDRENRVAIITGPNMAGKSTYMRQTALIVLMAQIGSFVPCDYARIGIVDAVFTRVGASDDLASGQSTFMVEMSEVANIVKSATSKSLLIFDEIGRGTSTYDGMSIARAVLEFIADKKKLGAKSLFATHYHELTVLEELLDGVRNYNVAVKKRGDDITFLRRIVPGGADDSYGIEVAKLAGVPDWIINRAKQILKELSSNPHSESINNQRKISVSETDDLQLSMIPAGDNAVSEKLRNTDIDTLTPIEAINLLYELKKLL